VLETLVYHVAINSVFRPSYLRNYHDLSKIINLWSRSPVLESDANFRGFVKAGLSAWLPIELFDILFKVSHLLHHRLSVAPDYMQARLRELRSRLHECQLGYGEDIEQLEPVAAVPNRGLTITDHDTESFHIRRVYSLAIELLITKLENPSLRAEESLVVSLCEAALHHLSRVRSDFTSLLWAITVLGTGMTTTKSQDLIFLHVEAMNHFAGGRAVRSVVEFLSCAWRPRPTDHYTPIAGILTEQAAAEAEGENSCSLGLGILFEESLLKTVIL
jgi:hypothetical protein